MLCCITWLPPESFIIIFMCDFTREQAQELFVLNFCLSCCCQLTVIARQATNGQAELCRAHWEKIRDLPCKSLLQPVAYEACFQTPKCNSNWSKFLHFVQFSFLSQAEIPLYGLESIKAYVAACFTAPIKIGGSWLKGINKISRQLPYGSLSTELKSWWC